MRTTLNIDTVCSHAQANPPARRKRLALVRMGLQALIEREASRRLAALGGSMRTLKVAARRRHEARRRK